MHPDVSRTDLPELKRLHPERAQIASQYGRMVEWAILRGEKKRAKDCVTMAFFELTRMTIATDSTNVEAVLPEKIAAALVGAGIFTLKDLRFAGAGRVIEIQNMRHGAVAAIRSHLELYGYDLGW